MRSAIVTDWLNQFGGAARVLMEFHELFPEAPVYTAVHEPSRLPPAMQEWDIRPTFLRRVPIARRRHQPFLPLMPLALEQLDLTEFDMVVTTSSACAKGIIPPPGALNTCYCYTPCRYIWDLYHEYTRGLRTRALIAPVAHWLRMWDQLSSQRVDHFMAISHEVASRIRRHYGRDAEVIHPPVDVDRVQPNGKPPEDFYTSWFRGSSRTRALILRSKPLTCSNGGSLLLGTDRSGKNWRHLPALRSNSSGAAAMRRSPTCMLGVARSCFRDWKIPGLPRSRRRLQGAP